MASDGARDDWLHRAVRGAVSLFEAQEGLRTRTENERPRFEAIPAALAPGGLLVVVHAARSNLRRHARPGRRHLPEDGELPGLARGLEVLRY